MAAPLLASGVVTSPAWAFRLATRRRAVWALDAHAGSEGGCGGCRACVAHARNKLFVSAAAADRGRAHPACGCAVVRAGSLPVETWRALFVRRDGSRRASVDRRAPSAHRLLRRAHGAGSR